MKKILLIISISLTSLITAQEIEEVSIESSTSSGQIMTANTMYTNKVTKNIIYDKTINDLILINSYDGSLKAYNTDKKMIWSFSPEDKERLHNGRNKLYYKDGVIFTAYLTGYVYALSAKDGSIFWQGKIGLDKGELKLRGQVLKPYNNNLYLTSENGSIYTLNTSNGELKWSYALAYNYNHVPNLVHNEIVYIPNAPYVYNFEAETGKALYQRGFKKAMYGKPVTDGNNIIIADESKTLFSLDPNDLHINWKFTLDEKESRIKEKIIVNSGSIYIGVFSTADQTSVYNIDAKNGTQIWKTKIPQKKIAYITINNDSIFGYTTKGNIFIINKKTGEITHLNSLVNLPISNLEFNKEQVYFYAKAGLIKYDIESKQEEIHIPNTTDKEKSASDSQIFLLKPKSGEK